MTILQHREMKTSRYPFQHWIAACVCLLFFGSTVQAQYSPVPSIKNGMADPYGRRLDMRVALFSALRSPSGTYQGELNGDFAEYARRALKAMPGAKILIDVKTIGTFEQPGCKRLHSDIAVPEVQWKDASGVMHSFTYQFEVNLCPDGRPPMPPEGGLGASSSSGPRVGQAMVGGKKEVRP